MVITIGSIKQICRYLLNPVSECYLDSASGCTGTPKHIGTTRQICHSFGIVVYFRKPGTVEECIVTDARYIASYRYIRNVRTDTIGSIKQICRYLLNPVSECYLDSASGCTGIMKHFGTTRQICHSFGIVVYFRKPGTVVECRVTDARYAIAYRHARQTITTVECTDSDARYTVRNRHARQTITIEECKASDARYAIAYRHAFNRTAAVEPWCF